MGEVISFHRFLAAKQARQHNQARIRSEALRWIIIITLDNARPGGTFEESVIFAIQAKCPGVTFNELRRELDYLAGHNLAKLKKQPDGRWFAGLTAAGIDVAEYTIGCESEIARPTEPE